MAKIRENLEKIHAAVVLDKIRKMGTPDENDDFGNALQKAAVKAIIGGIDSTDWTLYMSFFADNKDQLKLLTEKTPNEESYLDESRAYIAANVTCGSFTDTNVSFNVDKRLGETIPGGDIGESDGTIQKPFPIPPVTI